MRYLLGLLGVVGLVIVVVILIIRGFSDDPGKAGPALDTYADSATTVSFTTEAPVNAEQVHQAVRITVSRSEAKAEILQGYEDAVVNTISYPNNTEAYGVFLRALDLLGFDKGNTDPKQQDERGYCAAGNLHLMELNGEQVQRFWKTSCGEGNFGGNLGKINALFEAQIPEYDTFTKDVNL